MGMFDEYEPVPALPCRSCGAALPRWQSKVGPCLLLLWREGSAHPVRHAVDPDARMTGDALTQFQLAEDVEMITTCTACDRHAEATAFVVEGVWRGTVSGHHAGEAVVAATVLEGAWRQCSACADAWEEPARALAECPYCRAVTRLVAHVGGD